MSPLVTMERATNVIKNAIEWEPFPTAKTIPLYKLQDAFSVLMDEALQEAKRRGMQ